MPTDPGLLRQRRWLLQAWERFRGDDHDTRAELPVPGGIRPEIVDSWRRSEERVPLQVDHAPLADVAALASTWEAAPLRAAVARMEPQLRSAADDGGLVVAVTDEHARILWTCEGPVMRRRAELVNFVPGACWDEASVGTNALDLALRLDTATAVHSAEHFVSCVHDWTCWAAPIHDPATGRQLGVLDLSTTWDRVHPMGRATAAAFARLIEQALPTTADAAARLGSLRTAPPAHRTLELRVLGRAETDLDGVRLLLSRRQVEILALLALHPEGLSLDGLHAQLYGDRPVSPATLKAEVSHLRTALGGGIGSRPYRIAIPLRCDAVEVMESLRDGRLVEAAAVYGGDLLPGTDAPGLVEYANYLSAAVREALLATPEPRAVLHYAAVAPYDVEVLEHAVHALHGTPHPAAPLLRARLRAAYEL